MTVKVSRGISTVMFFRLLTLAPLILMEFSALLTLCNFGPAKLMQAERRKKKLVYFFSRGAAYLQAKLKVTKNQNVNVSGSDVNDEIVAVALRM